jgi:peptidyl-prolyl cis-trans isomerase-like 4
MSVLIETSLGSIVIDLFVKECPKTCLNFIKLCKIKYYNNCLFYDVQKDFLAQTGDPDNTGRGGNSIYGIINGEKFRYFDDEIRPQLKHNKLGMVSTANIGPNLNSSTFFIQLTDRNLPYLNDKHTVFGKVEEGFEVLEKLNKLYVDKDNRPYQNTRIKHTIILDDPFDDPEGLIVPTKSPDPFKELEYNRLEDDFDINKYYKDKETEEKVKEKLQEHEAKNRAIVLEMLDDIPDADIKPPDNVLFICKLNTITQDDDLEIIFSKFGPIKSCHVVRDKKTGNSLQYAFIEFEKTEDCEQAYFKMNGVVIDERRIKVDFSQSVARLWFNMKKDQDRKKQQDKGNEILLPNEFKKLELRQNKNFMNENKNYNLVFDEDGSDVVKKNSTKNDRRDGRDLNRHKNKKRSRSRSKSRDRRSHSRSREHKHHKNSRKYSRSRSRSRDRKHHRSHHDDKNYKRKERR